MVTIIFIAKLQNPHLKLGLTIFFAVILLYVGVENRFTTATAEILPIILAACVPFLSIMSYVHDQSVLHDR
jgi:hypothetical protein